MIWINGGMAPGMAVFIVCKFSHSISAAIDFSEQTAAGSSPLLIEILPPSQSVLGVIKTRNRVRVSSILNGHRNNSEMLSFSDHEIRGGQICKLFVSCKVNKFSIVFNDKPIFYFFPDMPCARVNFVRIFGSTEVLHVGVRRPPPFRSAKHQLGSLTLPSSIISNVTASATAAQTYSHNLTFASNIDEYYDYSEEAFDFENENKENNDKDIGASPKCECFPQAQQLVQENANLEYEARHLENIVDKTMVLISLCSALVGLMVGLSVSQFTARA